MKMMRAAFILLLIHLSQQATAPRVQTKSGPVVGEARQIENGNTIYSFLGIPYIKPPVGQLRFRPPEPVEPWTDDFVATTDTAVCVQKLFAGVMGTEDCIILNIYTPWDSSTSQPEKPLSVMVFIHGGGFIGGASGSTFSGHPDYLLQHDVVLVLINYRVSVLGFLSTEDEVAPGNYGLLDQVEALRWVKNNIASFGGNPNDVTIFGESAGSGSVHYLMLSPLAKGLFHRVIAQSGTAVSPWAATYTSKSNAQALAREMGCPETPSQELVKCLRGIDASKLIDTDIVPPEERAGSLPFLWSPRVDSEAAQPFLPKNPIELMRSGEYNRVPLLIGHTRTEGAAFMLLDDEHYKMNVDLITNNWDKFCQRNLGMKEFLVPEKLGSEMCKTVKEAYIDSSKSFEENRLVYADMMGDATFTSGIYKCSELMSKHSPVYNYLFNYESKEYYLFKLFVPGGEKVDGVVSHADDLMYIFKYPQLEWTEEDPEHKMAMTMTKIWTEFAKNGEPSYPQLNAPWPKASWPNHKYVVIDSQPSIEENYKLDKMKMFEEVYSNSMFRTTISTKDEL